MKSNVKYTSVDGGSIFAQLFSALARFKRQVFSKIKEDTMYRRETSKNDNDGAMYISAVCYLREESIVTEPIFGNICILFHWPENFIFA